MRECRGRVARWKDRTFLLLFTPLSLSTQSVQPDLISVLGGSVLLFVDSSVLVNFHSVCTSLIGSFLPQTFNLLEPASYRRQEKTTLTMTDWKELWLILPRIPFICKGHECKYTIFFTNTCLEPEFVQSHFNSLTHIFNATSTKLIYALPLLTRCKWRHSLH